MSSKGNKPQLSQSVLPRIRPAAKNLVANVRAFKADNEKEPEKLAGYIALVRGGQLLPSPRPSPRNFLRSEDAFDQLPAINRG